MSTMRFVREALPLKGALALLVDTSRTLHREAAERDAALAGALTHAMAASPRFLAKKGEVLTVVAPQGRKGEAYTHVLLVGIGALKECDAQVAQSAGASLAQHLANLGLVEATVCVDLPKKCKLDAGKCAAFMALGASLRSYRFEKYRTKPRPEDTPPLRQLTFVMEQAKDAEAHFASQRHLATGVFLARDVANEPPNVMYPAAFAARCQELATMGVQVDVLDEERMKALGMGALLGVGQGSVRESQLVTMHWKGADAKSPTIALVGKGVTFDTGGISIKPSNGMEDMKFDMCGAAAVLGTMHALAASDAKVNVVGVVGLVENMPDGAAQRPSDVVTSLSGQTIEVQNTDAEGRLVLADALWYCQEQFKPACVVDLATLTGAIVVALSSVYAGLFSNDDALADALLKASAKTDERVWRLPLHDTYDSWINSPVADMQNVSSGKGAGSITAAHFLKRFIQDGVAWAHIDIAGVAYGSKPTSLSPKGATGFGVRLLHHFVHAYAERAAS